MSMSKYSIIAQVKNYSSIRLSDREVVDLYIQDNANGLDLN